MRIWMHDKYTDWEIVLWICAANADAAAAAFGFAI